MVWPRQALSPFLVVWCGLVSGLGMMNEMIFKRVIDESIIGILRRLKYRDHIQISRV